MAKYQEVSSIEQSISTLYRLGSIYITKRLKSYQINPSQIPILLTVLKEEGLSQDVIANRLSMDKGVTSKMIAQLSKSDMIIKKDADEDKRRNKIYASGKLKKSIGAIQNVVNDWESMVTKGLSSKDINHLSGLLDRLVENAIELESEPPQK